MEEHRRRETQRVDPVEQAGRTGDRAVGAAPVRHAAVALDGLHHQVAQRAGGTRHQRHGQRLPRHKRCEAGQQRTQVASAPPRRQFGRRLVAGAFVFSAGLGLVATNCVNAFSYGYDRLRFIKPTFIGDTIYTIRTNLEKRPKYAELGLIRASYEVFKGEGELVLYCEHLQTVKYKNPADWVGKTEKA